MMACNCGGKKSGVKYEVSFSDGTKQKYDTLTQAQAAAAATGQPPFIKAVSA